MTEHELTRRDALTALGAAGIAVAGGAAALSWESLNDDEKRDFGAHERRTVHAVASTVYPSDVEGVESFVDGYVTGRVADDSARAAAMAAAVSALDEYANEWEGRDFVSLDPPTQDETLGAMGVRIATPDPDGDPRQRVRYYLVNDLLFALYSSPTGGRLVGIENPQGHPGGTSSYRQPPE